MNEEQLDAPILHTLGKASLYTAFFMEVAWKNYQLRTGHWYLKSLLENLKEAKEICGPQMLALIKELRTSNSRPSVLDVGCGPVSSLAHLVHEGLATVDGVDPLTEEYSQLLKNYGKKSPVNQLVGYGEYLERTIKATYDVVHIRNCLDHTQSPSLVWLNILKTVKVGGFVVQTHSINEATKENWQQFHQYNLFPDEKLGLWLSDRAGNLVSLTENLSLEPFERYSEIRKDEWMTITYQKTKELKPPLDFLSTCIEQLKKGYADRFNQSIELEKALLYASKENELSKYHFKGKIVTKVPF
jgi:2-polyprenyl-3-methyl-5-hydroxy-6-metoxy-1,4-benzoquinol methylase